jgi:hypothetical protein
MKKLIALVLLVFLALTLSGQASKKFIFEVKSDTRFPITLVNKGHDTLHVINTWQLKVFDHLLDVNSDYKLKISELERSLTENNLIMKKNGLLSGSMAQVSKSNELLVRNNEKIIQDAWEVHTETLKLTNQTTQSLGNIEDYFTNVTNSKIKKLRLLATVLGGGVGYFIGNREGSPLMGTIVGAGGVFALTYVF